MGGGFDFPTNTFKELGFQTALAEARKSASEGGIPIGACLVSADGKILGKGHNQRIQKSSATLHGEISALEDAGRLPASAYKGSTMYTTLSRMIDTDNKMECEHNPNPEPACDMCTGACILYKVDRVVIGENKTFVGGEALLKSRGIKVEVLDNDECYRLMQDFIKKHPKDWDEDIGEEP